MTPQRSGVVWIASYPKSGNTWVRFLVCNLVFGVQDSAAALNLLAPDIHEFQELPSLPEQLVLMKTHFPRTDALPLAERSLGAIYVVRDPGDVLLSNFHYARRRGDLAGAEAASAGSAPDSALECYAARYLALRGDAHWIDLHMGTWDEHVRSWLGGHGRFPVLPLRYEDLVAEPVNVARRICAFLGLTRGEAALRQAVEGASFQRLRQIEEQDILEQRVGIFFKPYLQPSIEAGARFMRAGRTGEAAQTLSPAMRARLNATFGPLMRKLGYEAGAAQRVPGTADGVG